GLFVRWTELAAVLLALALGTAPAAAEVVSIDVQSRSDVAGGASFGAAGAYEKVSGRIYFAVDPSLPANRIVTDIDKAPRNPAGRVEVSSASFLLQPQHARPGHR